ncbi:MAG: tRNA guanosine(34) transglycosylase Tgt [Candidatus Dormibacteria bacterium]
MRFALDAGSGRPTGPRAGRLVLGHGEMLTPGFMPVGTRGTVKAVDTDDLRLLGPGMILANAYHLWLSPGHAAVAAAGGLHRFMGWEGNLLTDSGGFQAASLATASQGAVVATVEEEGVRFSRDGTGPLLLTPELAIEIQEALAPDVMMALDQPLFYPASRSDVGAAAERTHRWAARCLEAWSHGPAELFGIVQGGFEVGPREESARTLRAMGFPGYGIGGLSLDEPPELTKDLILATCAILEENKPRYFMGLGSEPELLAAIGAGADLFDCVHPTRLARTGGVMVGPGRLNLRNAAFADDSGPIEIGCRCPACARYSRAHLRMLLLRGELLGYRLASLHNLHHLQALMTEARLAIVTGGFTGFVAERLANVASL